MMVIFFLIVGFVAIIIGFLLDIIPNIINKTIR